MDKQSHEFLVHVRVKGVTKILRYVSADSSMDALTAALAGRDEFPPGATTVSVRRINESECLLEPSTEINNPAK